jgi:hypothetical protein
VAAPSKVWVCGLSLAGIAGAYPTGDMDVCLFETVTCCHVEVSATVRALIQRNATEVGVCLYVCVCVCVWCTRVLECDHIKQTPFTPSTSGWKQIRIGKKERKKERNIPS